MKVAFVIHSLGGGGAERVTAHMANYWVRRENEVLVITIASEKRNQYKLDSAVEVLTLEQESNSTSMVSGGLSNLSRILALRKILKSKGAQVAISMMPSSNVVTCFAVAGLPILHIGSERHYPGFDYTSQLWSLLRKYSYRYIDSVITQTKASENWISDNTSATRIKTIPNPLVMPLENNSPVVPVTMDSNKKILLGVGRLAPQKQFSHLIESFARVSAKHVDWELVILGEGEERLCLESLISSLGLNHRVRLLGRVGNVQDWYDASEIFALTSESEGFPNALIEAMAHGLVCVSYDCLAGPADVIENWKNGVLVEANHINKLAGSLDRVMTSEGLRQRLSENSKEIRSLLNPEKVMSMWECEISLLCEKKRL